MPPLPKVLQILEFEILVAPRSVQHGLRFNRFSKKPFNDADKKLYLNQIMEECRHNAPQEPWDGPIGIEIDLYFSTEDDEKKGRWAWNTKGDDVDNCTKSILDSLAKCKFFKNDSTIFRAKIQKLWQEPDLWPRISVKLTKYQA